MPVPYREAFGEMEFELTSYEFDNASPGEFDTDNRVHSLRQFADRGWQEVTLEGSVELPADTRELFPPEERSDPPSKVTIAIDCPDTHYRYGETVQTSEIEEGTYKFEETIERKYAYGEVKLRPVLVRTSKTKDTADPVYAQYSYMRIADGSPITILFDDVETEGSSLMDVRFESFEKLDAIPDDNLYHLDRSDFSSPQVRINEDYELVTRVLDYDHHAGWAANFQGALAPWIAKDVVVELVLWALASAGEGGFDADWQEALVEEYVPRLYEYTDAEEPEDLREKLLEGGDDAHYIMNAVEKVVQDRIRITKPIEEFTEKEATEYFLQGK